MKINMLLSGCLLGLLCFTACDSEGNEMNDYTHYVNPFIGTGGHGHTHPGAMVPHGMIQPGPDTRIDGWDSCSGYYYEDTTINGFAHTRLSGTGCADFGDFLLMPTVGVQRTDFLGTESQKRPFASAFSHEKEYAEPGYYSVFLDTYGVKAELTSTERAAMHRYTFPESKESGFILDMDYNIQQQINQVMEVEAVNDTVLRGRKRSAYWAYRQDLYFYAVFSKPFTYTLYTDTVQENDKQIPVCKMLLHFETAKDEQVLAKFSISSVDAEGAYKNLQAEMPGWNFDGVRADAKKKWNECLSKIAVKTNDEDQRAIFYTAMYHAFLSPNLFTDVDGRYLGMDLKVHTTDMKHPVYTIFSLWDTFRALHPLLTIVDPQLNTEFIRSLIKKHQEGGIFPKWDCVSNYTGTMVGYHAASLVTDSYVKGYRDFDVQEAYKACLRAAEYDTTGIVAPDWLIPYVMPKARYYKNTLGYIPCDRIATNREMAAIDEEAELMYSVHLKTYSQFLESKAFKNLFKRKINLEGTVKNAQPQQEAKVLKFREETEGERKHITKEMDVIRRNPQLRQQCISRYGYQCQCCGMDFAEMYGEALGANFIEVHHLKPISTFETDGIPEDFVENLVPLCSNCHSMIHHIEQSDHPLRELREVYKGTKKELRVLKED